MKMIKYILDDGNLFLFISGEWLICRHTEEMTARILLAAVLTGFCLLLDALVKEDNHVQMYRMRTDRTD